MSASCGRRFTLLSATASLVVPCSVNAAPPPQPASYLWDNGGVNPFDVSVGQASMQRALAASDFSPASKKFFAGEWERFRPLGFDPLTNPAAVTIKDDDQWAWMFYGRGRRLSNVVANPSTWRRKASRFALLFTFDRGDGWFEQMLVPEVCGNVAGRTVRAPTQPDCIPAKALERPVRTSALWSS